MDCHFGFPEGASQHGAVVLNGDSHERSTLRRLKDQLARRPVDVLFIDGDHTLDGALADWHMYGPLVRAGGLVLFHDIECAGEPWVRVAWDRISAEVRASGGQTQEIVARAGKPLGFGIARMGDRS
jgi:predicted O-methyltransferase YrrM